MNEKDPALKIINEVFFRRTTYTVGKKVRVIEPMDEYWRECTALLILAVVHYLKEHRSKDEHCYFAVLDFINKASFFENPIAVGRFDREAEIKVHNDFAEAVKTFGRKLGGDTSELGSVKGGGFL